MANEYEPEGNEAGGEDFWVTDGGEKCVPLLSPQRRWTEVDEAVRSSASWQPWKAPRGRR